MRFAIAVGFMLLQRNGAVARVLSRLGAGALIRSASAEVLGTLLNTLIPQTISTVAALGVPDLLQSGPKTAEELSAATGAHPRSLHRALRAAAGIGILEESKDGRFRQTTFSALLTSDYSRSMRPKAIAIGQKWWWNTVGGLQHAVETGCTEFHHQHGQTLFEYLENHPEVVNTYYDYGCLSFERRNKAVVESFPFGDFETIVDIGGGRGELLVEILSRYPSCRGVLFERASVLPDARRFISKHSPSTTMSFSSGNFLESVPAGGDLYMLSQVLHDWSYRDAVRILSNIGQRLSEHGRLLIVEQVLPRPGIASWVALSDLNMMLMYGSEERSLDVFRALLAEAGLRLVSAAPLSSDDRFRIIVCSSNHEHRAPSSAPASSRAAFMERSTSPSTHPED